MKLSAIFIFILLNLTNTWARENCLIPERLPQTNYSKSDRKAEKKLCSFDFYNPNFQTKIKGKSYQVGICPKTFSTNPAVEVFRVPLNMSKERFERVQCLKMEKDSNVKKLAKFKSSITCSYTPSILTYYHFSRYFKAANVPATVYRTMNRDKHKEIISQALNVKGIQNRTIYKLWKSFEKVQSSGLRSKYAKRLFTADGKYLFGALSKNPKGEKKYKELNGSIRSYDQRFDAFVKTRAYNDLKKNHLLRNPSPGSLKNIQQIIRLKDLSDLLILDYIFSQQDRIGNIHYKNYYAFINDDGDLDYKKYKKKNTQLNKKMKAKGAVIVKRMMLKDNDCGVSKTNYTRKKGLIIPIAHASVYTYKKLLKLNRSMRKDELKSFFKKQLFFTDQNYKVIKENIKSLASLLTKRCQQGKLKLDADPSRYVEGRNENFNCS